MTNTTCTPSLLTLVQDLLDASNGLSSAAIRMLLVHTKECLQTGGDSTLTLEESARQAGISLSSAQKSLRTLAQARLVRRLRFGRNTHVRVLCIANLRLRGQEPLPLQEPDTPAPAVNTQAKPEKDPPTTEHSQKQGDGKTVADREKHEQALEAAKTKTHRAWMEATQNGAPPAAVLELSRRYSQLCTAIEQLKAQQDNTTPAEPVTQKHVETTTEKENGQNKDEHPSPPSRDLPDHLGARIRSTIRQVPGISSPTQVFDEIRHQVCAGLFREKGLLHATNICLKLLREGRWTTPWDYPQKTEAMTAA